MPIIAPSWPGFWDAVARARSVLEEAYDGRISDLNRAKSNADLQADIRQAGGTIDDQQLAKEKNDQFIDEHNESAARADPVKKALKLAAFWIGVGVVTFAAVKALK